MIKEKELKPFKNKIWLSSPTMHGDEQKYIKEAFDTNWVSTVGENINQLEKGICEYMGCKYGVALDSGTAAIHMALKMAGIGVGDKILCSSLTFAATVNPAIYEKAEVILIDSEYDTWNMDPKALERALDLYPEAKAVVVVNLYGTPARLAEIKHICNEHNIILIEDAAESLGATYKGIYTGTFGKYNAISFNGNKIITTSGGGMFLTNEKDAAIHVKKLSTQAREPFPWYEHQEIGYNYRMSNIVAGIGRGQLLYLDEHIKKKKAIYMRYKQGLKDIPVTMNPYLPDTEPNFWLSCILIDRECSVNPEDIRVKLAEYNAEARPIWKPMHMQPAFGIYKFVPAEEGKDVCRDLFNRGLCLPSDIKMSMDDVDKIIEIIKECFK